MMYNILNKLFGWDYVAWKNSADNGIARVFTDGDGVAYYFRYKNIKVVDRIHDKNRVIWLTCSPNKYMKD